MSTNLIVYEYINFNIKTTFLVRYFVIALSLYRWGFVIF